MNIKRYGSVGAAIVAALLVMPTAAAPGSSAPISAAAVDTDAIIHADDHPGDWLSHGRTYSEQRFSPLDKISTKTVKDLGVAWQYRTYSVRGLEASPIVVNGVMYITESWSKVVALDAKSGK